MAVFRGGRLLAERGRREGQGGLWEGSGESLQDLIAGGRATSSLARRARSSGSGRIWRYPLAMSSAGSLFNVHGDAGR
jgi:hypothetical protein